MNINSYLRDGELTFDFFCSLDFHFSIYAGGLLIVWKMGPKIFSK